MSHGAHKRIGKANTLVSADPDELLYTCLVNSGNFDMNIEASGVGTGGVEFTYECPNNQITYITRVNFAMLDGGIGISDFAGITNGLASGLIVDVLDSDDAVLVDYLDGATIKQNIDFGLLAGVDIGISPGTDGLLVRWSLFRCGAQLKLTEGQKLRITVQDDLSSLEKFNAMIQGTIFNE